MSIFKSINIAILTYIPVVSLGAELEECGAIQPVFFDEPEYPSVEVRSLVKVNIVFEHIITTNGTVEEIKVVSVEGSGNPAIFDEFYENASKSMQTFRFEERNSACTHQTTFSFEFNG